IQLFLFAGPLVFAFSEGPDDTAAVLGKIVATARGGSDDSIVVATGLESDYQETSVAGADGAFRFPGLVPGLYRISAYKLGFRSVEREVRLEGGETLEIEIVLPLDPQVKIHERVMVVADPSGADQIPGSAHYLGKTEMDRQFVAFGDIHRRLRQIPGINIQEEDGFGLRPNIGMRGTGVDRSANITLMEDGVLIAPAPYAAPAAYFFPVAARMKGIEVRKGSSQIKYGPYTHGGALNLISTPIPDDFQVEGDLAFGSYDTRNLYVNVGDSYRHFGWLAETYQIGNDGFKALDGGGDTGFRVEDYLFKFRLNTDPTSRRYQQVEFKFGKNDQVSNETYLGLTDEDFRRTPLRRYAASQEDVFRSGHEQFQVRHFMLVAARMDVTTTIYRNNFTRNWYKLDSVRGRGISGVFRNPDHFADEISIFKGADSEADALMVRANNRSYYSQGVQSVLGLDWNGGRTRNLLEVGFRYHEDQEDRFQHEDGFQMVGGRMALTSRGAPGSQSNRINDASAWAFFVQDTIRWNRLKIVPGLRYENMKLARTDFSGTDPERSAPTAIRTNRLDVFIPGVGVQVEAAPKLNLFGGVHKGFSPPGPGSTEDTEAERSLNYEFGARYGTREFHLEALGFMNRYSNLLGRDTLSAGGSGTGRLFNGGRALVRGMEASLRWDLREALELGFGLPVRVAYTLSHGEFRNSFESGFGPWGDVAIGDELPYLARHQLFAAIGVERSLWSMDLETVYLSRMRTEAGQGPIDPFLATDSQIVLNLTGQYRLGEGGTRLFVSLQNLTDDHSMTARRPAGARPNLPRTLSAGIRFNLGL
ncbi:MAG TPA: TonB-dependent receptor, partial [Acidobacteriota bacterium]|nr:TonB-dependent receptor [Acidobacteriota bacterium]